MIANELRLGNLVFVDDVTRELTKQMFKVAVIALNCQEIEPIPLTEEWLFKAGFENIQRGRFIMNILSYGSINVQITKNKLVVELGTTGHYLFGETKIEYVHQLQNLYFALTGIELELK